MHKTLSNGSAAFCSWGAMIHPTGRASTNTLWWSKVPQHASAAHQIWDTRYDTLLEQWLWIKTTMIIISWAWWCLQELAFWFSLANGSMRKIMGFWPLHAMLPVLEKATPLLSWPGCTWRWCFFKVNYGKIMGKDGHCGSGAPGTCPKCLKTATITHHHPNELPFIGHFFNLKIKFPWIVTG